LHWPVTVPLQSSLCCCKIHSLRNFSCLPNGKYQWVVFLFTGFFPLNVLTGFISSSGLNVVPQFSHWSPNALSLLQFGQVPFI
jgi:hypothetical protein